MPWFKYRQYLHFDSPINREQATQLVTSSERVASHSFYPFLSCELKVPKLKKSDAGKLNRNYKSRIVSYAAHKDSHIFSYYSYILNEKYEDLIKHNYPYLSGSILAFRKLGKSNIDFAKCAFDPIASHNECTVIALDVSAFFDNIDHATLKRMWCKVLEKETLPKDHYAVFKAITKFSMVDRDSVFQHFKISPHNPKKDNRKRICSPADFRLFRQQQKSPLFKLNPAIIQKNSKKGIPQGSPISALLSNIYMIDFDNAIFKFIQKITQGNGTYLRYCDDILCVIPNVDYENVENYIENEIKKLSLEINQSKTEIVKFTRTSKLKNSKSLQYLGFIIKDGSIIIRPAAFTKYSRKMKRGISLARQTQRKYNNIRNKRGFPSKKLFKKKLYKKYSHLGHQNFISYGKKAAKLLNSAKIQKQLKPLWKRLHSKTRYEI